MWELADRAFALAGFELEWALDGEDPLGWSAALRRLRRAAVVVDPAFIRPADPKAIAADPARIEAELGWEPKPGLDRFLEDMLGEVLVKLRSHRRLQLGTLVDEERQLGQSAAGRAGRA